MTALSARRLPSPAGKSAFHSLKLVFLLLAALSWNLPVQAQDDHNRKAEVEEMIAVSYGPDQYLINGIEYVNLHIRSEGHKFLGEDKYHAGSVVVENKTYHHVFLKYDIFNQQLLLLIEHPSGGNKQLIMNNLRIDGFSLDGRTFRKYTFPGTGTRFYQVLGSEEMSCLHHFRKQEISKPVDNNTLSEFTETHKRSFLYRHGELTEFKGNRSFVRMFSGHEAEIKAFIRENRFRVRTLSDEQMIKLIRYCQSITEIPSSKQ